MKPAHELGAIRREYQYVSLVVDGFERQRGFTGLEIEQTDCVIAVLARARIGHIRCRKRPAVGG